MSAPASKKQKIASAAAIPPVRGDDDDGGPVSSWADLPVTAWGHALDYLRYSEVRNKALLVSKTMTSEVPKHVQTLNIFTGAELHLRTTRRFPNCTELNVLCLLIEDQEDPEFDVLVEDVVHRVGPILPFFLKLKNVFIGRVWNADEDDSPTIEYTDRNVYDRDDCRSPDNHNSLYKYLVQSVAGMYDSGILMPHVSIEGIRPGKDQCCTKDDCLCRKIFKSFPFGAVIPSALSSKACFESDFTHGTFSCLPIKERIDIIKGRVGGSDYLSKLTSNLEGCLSSLDSRSKFVPAHYIETVCYLNKRQVQYIESLMECGCDPAALERARLLDRLRKYRSMTHIFVAKTTFDRLVAWGFPVKEHDFRFLDAATHPKWQETDV